jgi:hypothetical protein
MKRFLPLLALLGATLVLAAGTTANLAWTAPTAYTDGSAIANGDLATYVISWAPATGQIGPSGSASVAATSTSTTIPVACGSVTFTVAVTTSATAKYPNATSGVSNAVPYATGVTCAPNPPSALTAK